MRKYNNLRKKINQMAKASKGSIAPYIAYLDKIQNGYELRICLWDGKPNSQRKMPKTLFYKFETSEEAESYLLKYLQENKPSKNFVLFSNEEDILV